MRIIVILALLFSCSGCTPKVYLELEHRRAPATHSILERDRQPDPRRSEPRGLLRSNRTFNR